MSKSNQRDMSVEEFRVQISHVAWLRRLRSSSICIGLDVTVRYALHSAYLHATVATASMRAMGPIGLFDNDECDHHTRYPLVDRWLWLNTPIPTSPIWTTGIRITALQVPSRPWRSLASRTLFVSVHSRIDRSEKCISRQASRTTLIQQESRLRQYFLSTPD
jgi:hypothetical protein